MPLKEHEAGHLAAKLIAQALQKGILHWNERGWQVDASTMKDYIDKLDKANWNPARQEWKLKFAMPQKLYHRLREAKFDGTENFDDNLDVMKWLQKQEQTAFLKKFPLATADPTKV
jgi:hypothetical protein